MRVAQFIVAMTSRAVEAMARKAPLPTPIRVTIMPANRSSRRDAGCGRASRGRGAAGDRARYGQTAKIAGATEDAHDHRPSYSRSDRSRDGRCRRRHPGRAGAAVAPLASDQRGRGGGRRRSERAARPVLARSQGTTGAQTRWHGGAVHAALRRAALDPRQHHPRERHRLGSAAPAGTGRGARSGGHHRHRGDPHARAEIRRYRAGIRSGGATAGSAGDRSGEAGGQGRRARQLFHGRELLGRSAVADRRKQRQEHLLQSEEAGVLSQICQVGGPSGRAGLDRARRQVAAGVVSSAVRIPGRAAGAVRGVDSGHGRLQGAQRAARRRPLSVARHRGPRGRGSWPIRERGAGRPRQHPRLAGRRPGCSTGWRIERRSMPARSPSSARASDRCFPPSQRRPSRATSRWR